MTTQKQIRAAFWATHPKLPRKRIKDYAGTGRMYSAETRSAFAVYVDSLCRDGAISPQLAHRVTL